MLANANGFLIMQNSLAHVTIETHEVKVRVLPGNVISRPDWAKLFGVHGTASKRYEERGDLTPIWRGKRVFYDWDEVRDLMNGQ